MLNISENQKKLNRKIHFPRDMKILCNQINHSYRLIKEERLKEFLYNKVYIVKYEDFVNKPLFYLNEISKKFSLNANYENHHNIWQKTSKTVKTAYESDLWGKALNNSRVGVYKELLKKNEINEINLYCKEIINNFNY